MPIICPTIMAPTAEDYALQIKKISRLAHRIQVDLVDGEFAEPKTVNPSQAWWPAGMKADIHIMFRDPLKAATTMIKRQPHLIIVHAEAEGHFNDIAELCVKHKTKLGVALLAKTPASVIEKVVARLDHVLIFSGNLGKYGGVADFSLFDKIKYLKDRKPNIEIGWDGGINDQTVAELIYGGVDVLNVGSFIQKADDPERAFRSLQRIADETGTT